MRFLIFFRHPGDVSIGDALDEALATGDERWLRAILVSRRGLPGAQLDLRLLATFAGAVGEVILQPDPPVERLEHLLDGWAALSDRQARGDRPEVVLPCAAVAAFGEAAVVRPDWFDDEVAKLRRAAGDPRQRVREVVARSLARMLDADRHRTTAALLGWADDDDPLVARVAAAALAVRS